MRLAKGCKTSARMNWEWLNARTLFGVYARMEKEESKNVPEQQAC
jgi:hypothetical protein